MELALQSLVYVAEIQRLSSYDMACLFIAVSQGLVALAYAMDYMSINDVVDAACGTGLIGHIPLDTVRAFVSGNILIFGGIENFTQGEMYNIIYTGRYIAAAYTSNGIYAPWYVDTVFKLGESWSWDLGANVINFAR